ncbi:conserved hypothetical protein [Candidatus Magnetomoraceae bacterium gMMP-15]
MEQISQYISVKDIRNNPELIADILLKKQDVSVIFERKGDSVSYAYLKTYDRESLRLLQEAKEEHRRCKEKGYTREQAFEDLEEARGEISRYL